MAKQDKRNALSDDQLGNVSGGAVYSRHSVTFTGEDATKAEEWAKSQEMSIENRPAHPHGPPPPQPR